MCLAYRKDSRRYSFSFFSTLFFPFSFDFWSSFPRVSQVVRRLSDIAFATSPNMRGLLVTLSLAVFAAAAPTFSTETIHDGAAPILSSSNVDEIPNSYIIKFKDHVTDSSASDHHSWLLRIHNDREDERFELRKRGQIPLVDDVFRGLKHTYKIGGSFMGYSGHFDDAVIEQVRRHPDVSTHRISVFSLLLFFTGFALLAEPPACIPSMLLYLPPFHTRWPPIPPDRS